MPTDPLRIAVIGGGSLGLYLGGRLSLAGHAVTVVQRTAAPAPHGVVADGDECWQAGDVGYATAGEPAGGPFAQVVVAVKSHDLPPLLPALAAFGDDATEYVFLQNGIPWWWPAHDGDLPGAPALAKCVAVVVHHAVERTAPGRVHVRRTGRDRYACARPPQSAAGGDDAALDALVAGWRGAGIPAERSADIRGEVWAKLMGNATLNPLSAIIGATVGELATAPATRAVLLAGMAEIGRIAAAEGCALLTSPEARVERAAEVGAVRTSMLQDRLAGRRLETGALLAAPIALAERHGIDVPVLRTLLGCLRFAAAGAGNSTWSARCWRAMPTSSGARRSNTSSR